MRIQIVSDLHNEAHYWVPPDHPENSTSVLVVAGDICVQAGAADWLKTIASKYYAVVAVLGNHDHWDYNANDTVRTISESLHDFPNVHILERNTVVINDTRFIGCTLWTYIPPDAHMPVQDAIKDFKRITVNDGLGGQQLLSVPHTNAWHAQDKQFLKESLSIPFDGTTVVVTHHAPSSISIDQRYKENPGHAYLNYAYHTDMNTWAQGLEFDCWIHGHTHHSFDYPFGSGKLICNPRGYWPDGLNPDFNSSLAFDSVALKQQRRSTISQSYEHWWDSMATTA